MIAAMSLGAVIKFGDQMNDLGATINATEKMFIQLTGGIAQADALMAQLRQGTRGAVDDLTLMAGATKLLNLGVTSSNEQTAKLIEQITLLKDPTVDVTSAINDFGLMMANASYLRLDTFNLSSSRVRDRVNELAEEFPNLDRQARFTMATIEEMERKVSSLGDAAGSSITRLQRWETAFTNAFQELSQNLNTGVESGIGIIEIALGVSPQQIAQTEQRAIDAAISVALDTQRAIAEVMQSTGQDGDADFISAYVQRALEMAKTNPELTQNAKEFADSVFQDMRSTGDANFGDFYKAGSGGLENIATQVLQLQAAYESERAIAADVMTSQQAAADAAAEQADAAKRATDYHQMMYTLQQRYGDEVTRTIQEQERAEGQRNQMLGSVSDIWTRSIEARQGKGNNDFLTSGAVEEMHGLASEAQRTLDIMKEMDAANDDIFTDEEMARAEGMAEHVGRMADSAEDAAEAFKNISLKELFGQTDGGTQGEMFDAIKRDLEEMQFTAEHIAGIQKTFDLASGRQTGASAFFEDTLSDTIAGVAANISQDLALGMLEDFDAVLKEATLRGIDESQPDFIEKLNETFNRIDFDPENFNVNEFLAEFDPAAQATTTMSEQGTAFADSTTIAKDNMAATESSAANIGTTLEKLAGKTTKIPVELQFVNMNALFQLLFGQMVTAIQGAGGVVPGTNQRHSTSGSEAKR